MSITSLSSYSDLYSNSLLNSIASSASTRQNVVQDFQSASGEDATTSQPGLPTVHGTPRRVHHHAHGHHHSAANAGNSAASVSLDSEIRK